MQVGASRMSPAAAVKKRSKKESSKEAPRDDVMKRHLIKALKKTQSSKGALESIEALADFEHFEPLPKINYTPADLRPGFLMIPEFSRPGGIKFEKLDPGS